LPATRGPPESVPDKRLEEMVSTKPAPGRRSTMPRFLEDARRDSTTCARRLATKDRKTGRSISACLLRGGPARGLSARTRSSAHDVGATRWGLCPRLRSGFGSGGSRPLASFVQLEQRPSEAPLEDGHCGKPASVLHRAAIGSSTMTNPPTALRGQAAGSQSYGTTAAGPPTPGAHAAYDGRAGRRKPAAASGEGRPHDTSGEDRSLGNAGARRDSRPPPQGRTTSGTGAPGSPWAVPLPERPGFRTRRRWGGRRAYARIRRARLAGDPGLRSGGRGGSPGLAGLPRRPSATALKAGKSSAGRVGARPHRARRPDSPGTASCLRPPALGRAGRGGRWSPSGGPLRRRKNPYFCNRPSSTPPRRCCRVAGPPAGGARCPLGAPRPAGMAGNGLRAPAGATTSDISPRGPKISRGP